MNQILSIRRIAALFGALLLLAGGAARADLSIEITKGAEGALPIAIVPFEWTGPGSPPKQDIAGIVTNDLKRSGLFAPLAEKDFISRPSRLEEVRFQNWRALGVDNLLIGGVTPAGPNQYQVRFELLDVYSGKRLLGKRYRVDTGTLRTLAHTISDEVFKQLIGKPGAFGNKIAYVTVKRKDKSREFSLVLSDSDGYGPQKILTSKAPILSPAWSPDGKKLAYVSFENNRSEIYVQEIASGRRYKIASYKGINGAPAWSPDGRKIALTLSKSGNADIYVLDPNTGDLRQLTKDWAIDTEPTWMPDGQSIVFTSDRGGSPQLYQIPANGGTAKRLTFDGNYNAKATISPDGKQIAMVHREGKGGFRIAVLDLDSGLTRVLTDGPEDESPSFSPNGVMLIYATTSGERGVLGIVSVNGKANQQLGTSGEEIREPAWAPK